VWHPLVDPSDPLCRFQHSAVALGRTEIEPHLPGLSLTAWDQHWTPGQKPEHCGRADQDYPKTSQLDEQQNLVLLEPLAHEKDPPHLQVQHSPYLS
jgi:hypothetical protein